MVERRQLLVKFVPWNDNTFSSLKDKTIKFSTVYELNDYNEFNYIGPSDPKLYQEKKHLIKEAVQDLFSNYAKRCEFSRNLRMSPYTSSFVNEFMGKFQNFDNFLRKFDLDAEFTKADIEDLRFLIENIAYTSVGIFSCSDIEIFKTGWAQLLFAYYAKSLRGLALIYEQRAEPDKFARPINYTDSFVSSDYDLSPLSWYAQTSIGIDKQDFMNNFNKKLDIWKSECEKRICSIPGIKEAADFGLELKAVLYTQRIQEDLCKVREAISDSVKLKKIHTGYAGESHLFKITDDNKIVTEWLKLLQKESNDSPKNTP